MDTNEMRKQVRRVYRSKTWADKVDRMNDPQLFAIFMRFRNEGKIQ